jgi:hypothetical protein
MDFCHGYAMSSDDPTEIISHISRYGCASHSNTQNIQIIFKEIEDGITAYEKENEHQQVRDECRGMYIPTNVVRRLIQVRKDRIVIGNEQRKINKVVKELEQRYEKNKNAYDSYYEGINDGYDHAISLLRAGEQDE